MTPDLFDREPFAMRFRSLAAQETQRATLPAAGDRMSQGRPVSSVLDTALADVGDLGDVTARRDEQLSMSGGVESRHTTAQEDRRQVGKALPVTADALSPTGQPCAHRAGVAPDPLTFTRSGSSIVPPTPDELARQRRDQGIERAAEHAHRIDPDWQDKAVALVRWYAGFTPTFLTEDFRAIAAIRGLPEPPDGRAYGAVMQRAAREGIVIANGYAKAKSSNCSAKVLWLSLVQA